MENPLAARSRRMWLFAGLLLASCACSRGPSSSGAVVTPAPPPPPPPPSFALSVSPAAIVATIGEESPAVVLTVLPRDGFAGTVAVSVDGLPPGLAVQPGPSLQLDPGQTAYLVFNLPPSLSPGEFAIAVRGQSGPLSSERFLALTARAPASLPSPSSYVRVDETPGYAHGYRNIAYHRPTGLAFAANDGLGTVDVISVSEGRLVKRLPAPGCLSSRLTPDGSRVIVSGQTDYVLVIDPVRAEIVASQRFAPFAANAGLVSRPADVVPMADGTWFVRAERRGSTLAALVQWDPIAGTVTDRTPPTPVLATVDGLEPSPDGQRLLAFAGVTSGDVAMYDITTNSVVGSQRLGNIVWRAAWRPDGQHVAVQDGCCEVVVLDRDLRELTRLSGARPVDGFVYEGSGRSLVLSVWSDIPAFAAWDASTYQASGLIPTIPFRSTPMVLGTPLASDERGVVLAALDRGVALIDASQPLPPVSTAPVFFASAPDNGSPSATTSVSLLGQDLVLPSGVWFGSEPATVLGVDGSASPAQLQVVAPPSARSGPVNVAVSTPDGWYSIVPDGFSYGPTLLGVDPSGGAPTGGSVSILGYGFGYAPSEVQVTIGGRPATIESIAAGKDFSGSLFSRQTVRVVAPLGAAGPADVGVSTPAGAAVLRGAYWYTAGETVVPLAAPVFQVVYDPVRERVYASEPAAGQVEVVDLARLAVIGAFTASANPAGIALAQDGSSLAIAGYGDAALFMVDPDGAAPARRIEVLDPADTVDDPRPLVVAQGGGRVFVGMARTGSSCFQNQIRQVDLASGAVTSRQAGACATGIPYLAASPSGDRIGAAFGDSSDGPYVELSSTTDTHRAVFTGGFLGDLALSAISASIGGLVLDADLGIRSMLYVDVHGLFRTCLHSTGSLVYATFTGGLQIFDGHTGRVRWAMPLADPPAALWAGGIAVDAFGRRVFLATQTGLTIVDLGAAPLGIGDVEPRQATAGEPIAVRGSGFLPGTLVQIGHRPAQTTFIDPDTLQALVPEGVSGSSAISVENPGREIYELPAAITVAP